MAFERILALAVALLTGQAGAADLAYSTYLKNGFTPKAIAADAQGNLYLAGTAVTDSLSGTTAAAVAKLNPSATQFLYFVYLDGAASDDLNAIAVDRAGNAYVAGATSNPRFPATTGKFAAPPNGAPETRSFVTKLDANGAVNFSVLLGGSTASVAQAVALTTQGNILVSGLSTGSGFPSTKGAFSIADSKNHPFLLELDAAAANVLFSATGIGGSSLALDSAGNIYVAGSTVLLDYPTTPGAYQTTFTPSFICYGLCQLAFPGGQQYVSKIDPTGSRLIYSTGLNGSGAFRSGSIRNTGLAVDATGNAYLTGVADAASNNYPFTTPPPAKAPYEFGFLSKLDASGSTLLFSVPVGGGGVMLDSTGALYTAGIVTSYNPSADPPAIPVAVSDPLSAIPPQCLPDNVSAFSEAYLMKLEPASGAVLDTQWVDGTDLETAYLTLAAGKPWIAGWTKLADVPITSGAVTPSALAAGLLPGAYLAAADFVAPAKSAQLTCVVDGGNLMHAGVIAPGQLVTLFGNNLSNAAVTFDGVAAKLLYSSESQINAVAPASISKTTMMELSVDGSTVAARQLPVVRSNPNLLADRPAATINCAGLDENIALVALNADGSRNTCGTPAKLGSAVSIYLHGVANPGCYCFDVTLGYRSVEVLSVTSLDNGLSRVDVQVPATFDSASVRGPRLGQFQLAVSVGDFPAGPFPLPTRNITNVVRSLMIFATL
jgi:uncharacterized protein (TIGR03437 family)